MCPQPKRVPNAKAASGGRFYPGHVIIYTCNIHGYIFPEGGWTRSQICRQDGHWHPPMTNGCIGKYDGSSISFYQSKRSHIQCVVRYVFATLVLNLIRGIHEIHFECIITINSV